jgi:hypothetical protein
MVLFMVLHCACTPEGSANVVYNEKKKAFFIDAPVVDAVQTALRALLAACNRRSTYSVSNSSVLLLLRQRQETKSQRTQHQQ